MVSRIPDRSPSDLPPRKVIPDRPHGLLTVGDVSKLLGIGRTTVHDYESAGLLLADLRTPGGHRRYSRATVEEFLRKVKTGELFDRQVGLNFQPGRVRSDDVVPLKVI